MRISTNIAFNFLSKVWGFLSLYLFSRIFLNLLGIDLYGIISFYTLIFGTVSFADAGLSATINREFAKDHSHTHLKRLLHFFERWFILLCIIIAVIIVLFSEKISLQWLSGNSLSQETLASYVQLIGIAIGTQLMSSIYFGALMGRQLQVRANGIQMGFSVTKTIGGAMLLYYFPQNLYLFFVWQVLCNISQFSLLRHYIFLALQTAKEVTPMRRSEIDPSLWKYLGGMTLIAVLSSLTIQSDKLAASKLLNLADFGYYSLASALSQLNVIIVTPIGLAIFPLLVRSYTSNNMSSLYKMYETWLFGIAVLVTPVCSVLCLFGKQLFEIWISQKYIAAAPAGLDSLIIFLSIGNTFQALMIMPFYFLLAQGRTKFTIYQASAEVVFLVPALYLMATNYGIAGLGVPWLIVKFTGYFYLIYTVEKLNRGNIRVRYKKAILYPALVSSAVAIILHSIYSYTSRDSILTILFVFITLITSLMANLWFYDRRMFNLSYAKALIRG